MMTYALMLWLGLSEALVPGYHHRSWQATRSAAAHAATKTPLSEKDLWDPTTTPSLSTLKVAELRQLVLERGGKPGSLKKAELVAVLSRQEGAPAMAPLTPTSPSPLQQKQQPKKEEGSRARRPAKAGAASRMAPVRRRRGGNALGDGGEGVDESAGVSSSLLFRSPRFEALKARDPQGAAARLDALPLVNENDPNYVDRSSLMSAGGFDDDSTSNGSNNETVKVSGSSMDLHFIGTAR